MTTPSRRTFLRLSGAGLAASALPLWANTNDSKRFHIHDGQFVLDGHALQIICGEMEYPRVPRAYWRDRMRKAKAMGLNTLATYVYWNLHEPEPGVYDFSANYDLAEYIRQAQQEGLHVLLRPGPYICTEWDFGGLPAWLLKDPATVVRSLDPKFIEPVRRWFERLGREVASLQIENSGPILMVQVENEYGSFDKDHAYMEQIHRLIAGAGFTQAQLYTADGPEELPDGALPELPACINFGPGEEKESFEALKKLRPQGPFFASEYWAGYFDFWGEKYRDTNTQQQVEGVAWMLGQGYSVNIYMFHGGTTFGLMNGGNSKNDKYRPFITSYDFDSALDESGRPTQKYHLFRDAIEKVTGAKLPPVPPSPPAMTIPSFPLARTASLWSTLPRAVLSADPLAMEQVGQSYGYILYRTQLVGPVSGTLAIDALHDYAQIYLDGVLQGTLDRRLQQNSLSLNVASAKGQLDILIENTGRVNFGMVFREERKGITKSVTLNGKAVRGWEIYPLPLNNLPRLLAAKGDASGPGFYRGTFHLTKIADTFLDTSGFGKGVLWLNGAMLGRIWDIGPQKALYAPAPWLREGVNEVIVFDLKVPTNASIAGLDHPVLKAPVSLVAQPEKKTS